uniref:ORF1 n=1 Tax=uncultured densovirus TaxID=748192 RepID=A0A7M4BC43_9VIRU|nr:ORF1 [uncultured densovirus]
MPKHPMSTRRRDRPHLNTLKSALRLRFPQLLFEDERVYNLRLETYERAFELEHGIRRFLHGGKLITERGSSVVINELVEEDFNKLIKKWGLHTEPFVALPDHNFLGPGNDAYSGQVPLDSDDRTAQQHDKDYANAKSQSDIREADREFISASIDETLKGNLHSAIGGAGVGLKYLGETFTGVKYPPNLPPVSGNDWSFS